MPSTTLAGTGQWSDFQNSDPVAAITAQRSTILLSCTKEPNTLLVGYPVWLQLIQHPIILDRFKNHALPLGYPTDQQLAGLFNVDNFVVAKALYDTAQQGIAHNLNYIWGKNAILAYVPPGKGQLMITPGTTFRWLYGVPQNGGHAGEALSRGRAQRRHDRVPDLLLRQVGCAWRGLCFQERCGVALEFNGGDFRRECGLRALLVLTPAVDGTGFDPSGASMPSSARSPYFEIDSSFRAVECGAKRGLCSTLLTVALPSRRGPG